MTASLQQSKENKPKWYIVLRWKDYQTNKWKTKWIKTDLLVSDNTKRKAEQKRLEVLAEWSSKIAINESDILFSEFLKQWLETAKHSISENTYFSYKSTIYKSICPHFEAKKIKLSDLKPYHIQDFYNSKLNEGLTANTICHFHANIHKALNYAVKTELIKENPADKIELPKKEKHIANYYTGEELKTLLKYAEGSALETVIYLAVWFGLRRGEIIGLKWDYIDFENKSLSIVGTVTDKGKTGSRIDNLKYRSRTKTESSMRTFPLTNDMVDYLKKLKEKQLKRQRSIKLYNMDWKDFVCVRPNGDLIPLDYVTRAFPRFLKNCGLRPIKLHELRHSNISLLIENGATMKEAQEWAGHSSYSTTANIYSHIEAKSKSKLTQTLQIILG